MLFFVLSKQIFEKLPDVGVSNNVTISSDFSKEDRNVSTLRSISQGMNEKYN